MRSKPLQAAHEFAEAYVRSLTDKDARGLHARFHGHCVQVIHDEGTVLVFQNAFAVRLGVWEIIISEHHDIHIYERFEARVTMFKQVDIEQISTAAQSSLEALFEKNRGYEMSEEEKAAQRRSFVYGNVKIANEHVTWEMVDQAIADQERESVEEFVERVERDSEREVVAPILASIGLLSQIWEEGFESGYTHTRGSGADAYPDWRVAEVRVKAILASYGTVEPVKKKVL